MAIKFDEFDLEEVVVVLDTDDRYDLILGISWLIKHEQWIDWRSRAVGACHKPLVERALVGHVFSSTRHGIVHEHHIPRSERLLPDRQRQWVNEVATDQLKPC